MRLANSVYEILPAMYAGIGGCAFLIAYADPQGVRTVTAFCIGFASEIAALTVFLRRQDYRARRREYSAAGIELLSLDPDR